ncbi:MAG TPA: SDR family oxidoreductase [Steroidobacteraceae bacterium]|jgi:NAD(P)-dependent dehydrogenase (short-subunit alcohol dehydrogenase family)|nr:SDR family oxidoreductase [Steroidobacteraceae bacterium]
MVGQVVVITGASAGAGRATAQAFARRGARIGLIARGVERLEETAREVDGLGGHGLALPTDVANADAVMAAASAVEAQLGPIDIWINAAMATVYAPFHAITSEEYRRATEVTYLGTVHGTQAALHHMRPRNRGTIIQVGSALAYRAIPLQSPYCGAKFAIRGFTDSLRSELMHDRLDIHLTMVQMPALNTPQFDWGRNKLSHRPQPVPPVFQPEVAAEAIVYAATARRREVWVGEPTYKAIIGNKLAPGIMDRYLARQGYAGQITREIADPALPDNLFEPVPGHQGAHGRFDDRAQAKSLALSLTKHRAPLLVAAGAAGLLLWQLGRIVARKV